MPNELDQTAQSQMVGEAASEVIDFAKKQVNVITTVLGYQSKNRSLEGVTASQEDETSGSDVWRKAIANEKGLKALQELGQAAQKIQQKIMSAGQAIDPSKLADDAVASVNAADNAPAPAP